MSRIRAHHHVAEKAARVRQPQRDGRRARIQHFNMARSAACQELGIPYKPIAAPRDTDQLLLAIMTKIDQTAEQYRERRRIPVTYEMLTEAKRA